MLAWVGCAGIFLQFKEFTVSIEASLISLLSVFVLVYRFRNMTQIMAYKPSQTAQALSIITLVPRVLIFIAFFGLFLTTFIPFLTWLFG
jgi:hypothetical protein